jgi:hypothetical protein
MFPEECREVVHQDPVTLERHVADVKTANNMVIELQNSPMSLPELRSREAFYGRMIWIVNAAKFQTRFHVLGPVPRPSLAASAGIVFFKPRKPGVQLRFWLRKENEPGTGMVQVHPIRELADFVESTSQGHHLFVWDRPHTVWFDSDVPVFFDFGDKDLLRLKRYDDDGLMCVQRISKDVLVRKNGGQFTPFGTEPK